jgi:predicted Rossmann fold flavoprotein
MKQRIAVIGAGASGLMAAGTAACTSVVPDVDVLLFEKNDTPGKKLLITGKGRCNLTSSVETEDLISNTPGNGSFLYSSFYTYSNWDIINFFNSHGVKTKIERGQRVFPVSDRSEDVVRALTNYVKENNVRLITGSPVKAIKTTDGKVSGVVLKNMNTFECSAVILATGGASYTLTGSTGDGYQMAAKLGHKIISLKPSLVPLTVREKWIGQLKGLSLKNVSIKLLDSKGRTLYQDFGEMLFTHFGVSGPLILSASRHIPGFDYKGIKLSIDLKPALSEEQLDKRVIRDFEKYSKKQFKNSLDDLLPKALIPVIIRNSGIDEKKFVNQISKDERRVLIQSVKNLKFAIDGARPLEEAIVTAGGVSTDEINPSTMESKLVKGLYFAGEIIDVDAYTGGFNLTIAFSTGYLAGKSASKGDINHY